VPGPHGEHAGVGTVEDLAPLEERVSQNGRQVLGRRGLRQRVGLGQVLAQHVEEHPLHKALHALHLDALGGQVVVELAMHHAVLAFLTDEVLDLLKQVGILHAISKVAHAGHEKALALRKDGRHGVEVPRLERVAAEPVLGDAGVQLKVQLLTGHDGTAFFGGRGGFGHGEVQGANHQQRCREFKRPAPRHPGSQTTGGMAQRQVRAGVNPQLRVATRKNS
jgi:hypothetical protein